MSYRAKKKSNYGDRSVRSVQASRSRRAQSMDSKFKAPLAKTEAQWMNNPSHYDLPSVDAPKSPQTINTPQHQVINGEKMQLSSTIIDQNKIDLKEQQFRSQIRQSYINSDKSLSAMNRREPGTFIGVSAPLATEKTGYDFREFVRQNYVSATLSAPSQTERLRLANELHQVNTQLKSELIRIANEELDKLKRGM